MRIIEHQTARFWLDAEEPGVAHRDHEVASADPQHHRRLVLHRVIARRPAPRTRGGIEPGDRASLVCADLHHQDAVDHDRRGCEAVVRLARTLASDQVRAPEEPPRGQLHGDQVTARAQSEHTSVGDGGCRNGAVEGTVAALEGRADLNAPGLLARAHIEGNGDVLAAVREQRDRASGRDGHARVAAAELRAPAHGQASRCASEAAAGRCAAVVVRPTKARPLALGRTESEGCERKKDDRPGPPGGVALIHGSHARIVGGWPVDRRHLGAHRPQVARELAAMMDRIEEEAEEHVA